MKAIKFIDYLNEPNGARKEQWKQNILDALKTGPKGDETMLKWANNDVDKIMKRHYDAYLVELAVLNHLQKKNPDQIWKFVDEYADSFKLSRKVDNEPDLVNNTGITVEVKNKKIYFHDNCKKVYFDSFWKTVELAWQRQFHDADYVIIYDPNKLVAGILSREQFIKTAVKETKENTITWIVELPTLYELN